MTKRINPILQRYADGEISAMQAAGLFGGNTVVAEVIVWLLQAGLMPPEPPLAHQQAELARARRVFGFGPKAEER